MKRASRLILTYVAKPITATISISVVAVIMPFIVLAQDSQLKIILTNTQEMLTLILQISMTLAFVVFIWGIVRFIAAAGNPQQIKQAKSIIVYGIIGIAIMAMTTGIIVFLQLYFGIPGGGSIKIPQF